MGIRQLGRFRPIGETDSEHAFCFLLDRVARAGDWRFLEASELVAVLREPVTALSELGELNLLMSDGTHPLAFANTKVHWLRRCCVERSGSQSVIVLTTSPLTDEPWSLLPAGLQAFAHGERVAG